MRRQSKKPRAKKRQEKTEIREDKNTRKRFGKTTRQ